LVRNTIFRKAPPSVVSGYGKRSINLNKVVANFEKHIRKKRQIGQVTTLGFSKEYKLTLDVSDVGVGAVLLLAAIM
jgi:hypothetical protein